MPAELGTVAVDSIEVAVSPVEFAGSPSLHVVVSAVVSPAGPESAVLGCSPAILWNGAGFAGAKIVTQIGAVIHLIVESESVVLDWMLILALAAAWKYQVAA